MFDNSIGKEMFISNSVEEAYPIIPQDSLLETLLGAYKRWKSFINDRRYLSDHISDNKLVIYIIDALKDKRISSFLKLVMLFINTGIREDTNRIDFYYDDREGRFVEFDGVGFDQTLPYYIFPEVLYRVEMMKDILREGIIEIIVENKEFYPKRDIYSKRFKITRTKGDDRCMSIFLYNC